MNRNKTKINFKKIFSFFAEHKKITVITMIIISIVVEIIVSHYSYKALNGKTPYLELLYYSTQIISSICVTTSVIIAAWQFYLTSKSTKTNLEVIQVQRAIDLSEYYKDNILCHMRAINYIFDITGVTDIIKKIDPKQMKNFDECELKTFLTDEDINFLSELGNTEEFFNCIQDANLIYNLNFNMNENTKHEDVSAFAAAFFSSVLNNMEFFAMHFSHKVADETVIYQSIHQTYLRLVHLLYYHIAKQNSLAPGKFYTNVIDLYITWNKYKDEQEKDYLEGVRNLQKKGTIISN